MNWKFRLNTCLCIIGPCLLIIGSTLFHPHFSTTTSLYKTGVVSFTSGCFLLCCASLIQLVFNFKNIKPGQSILIDESQSFDMDLAVSLCRNTIGSISCLLFVVGSAAFWPSFGDGGALVGNWFYRFGASLGALNSMWLLIREPTKSLKISILKLMGFLSLLGSIGFLIGGVYFLRGGNDDAIGAFSWLSGSIAILLSSLLLYIYKSS